MTPSNTTAHPSLPLTSFSIDGEYTSNTLSEPREWLLRASATPSNKGNPETSQGILVPRL